LISDRCIFSPFGLFGGRDGLHGSWTLDPGTEQERPLAGLFLSKATAVPMPAGTVLRIRTGGGGGYGDPLERDPELVRRDVVEGWVSPEAARAEYGVVLAESSDSWTLEATATISLRAERVDEQRSRMLVLVADASLDPTTVAAGSPPSGSWLSLLGKAPAPVRVRPVPGDHPPGTAAVSPDTLLLLGLTSAGGPCLVLPGRGEER
jgi:hypothetical protein